MSELVIPLQLDAYTIQICSAKGQRRGELLE
jgi:hypothetical protein